jgi:ABC-type proline/glycine betaine transport system substrate-binding protein
MSFRRSSDDQAGSSRWRKAHRAELSRWLPSAVIDSDRSLLYVLLHGDDELGTGWTPEWLSQQEAGEFLAFLESDIQNGAAYQILDALRRRAVRRK